MAKVNRSFRNLWWDSSSVLADWDGRTRIDTADARRRAVVEALGWMQHTTMDWQHTLMRQGLRATDVGLDLSQIDAGSVAHDAIKALRIAYLSPLPAATWPPLLAFWAVDEPLRHWPMSTTKGGSKAASRLLEPLRRRGFVRVREWGVDVAALNAQANAALSLAATPGGSSKPVRTSVQPCRRGTLLPALAPLLDSPMLSDVIHGYLGPKVRYDGHTVLELPQTLTDSDQYLSGIWHQDRARVGGSSSLCSCTT
jgi:hypothetical protein